MQAAKAVRAWDRKRDRLEIRSKEPGSLVTSADFAADRAVRSVLDKAYPRDGMLSEESGAHGDQDSCWVLDPLDGTTNFVHGLPDYCISLAYCRGGKPQIGVIYDVCRDDIYAGEQGRGAFCNHQKIHVSSIRRLGDALISLVGTCSPGTSHWKMSGKIIRGTAGMRRSGSAALDLAHVARGSLDIALCRGLHYWDYAAGAVLVTEAGGEITSFAGRRDKIGAQFGERLDDFVCGSTRMVGGLKRRLEAEIDKTDSR